MAAARAVPRLTPAQEHRGITAAIGHHSFAPPLLRQYYGDGEIPHWVISGTSVITDEYVRLTADQKSQTGHLWNTEPLDMDAFEVVVGFRVYRPMGGFGADGFGVWVAQPPRFDGPLFGRPSTFNGFGVLFDSYDNDNRRDNPMVSLVYNDGSNTKHFDPERDFMGDSVASCVFDFREIPEPNMATMRMVYFKGELQVYLSRNSEATETECLKVTRLPMPEGKVYLSLSAQTGGVSEIHDIMFVHLSPLVEAKYDHDVRQTTVPTNGLHDARLYDNEAMNNRQTSEVPTDTHLPTMVPQEAHPAQQQHQYQEAQPTQQQHQYQEAQPTQQQHQYQEAQPTQQQHQYQEAQPTQQQHQYQEAQAAQQQQQNQPSAQATDNIGEKERQRIEELERRLEELQGRNGYRATRRIDEEVEELVDYDDEDRNRQRRVRRVRRARTPRSNRVEQDE
ncbi:putative lectin [Leishmania infantum JPCM5]|uniref:Mannose-specific_lectin_-_putative n=2 Tax=Leishmania infantum TaxID=5671 RepID=A0A6L0WMB5_LEIIN|nr:putative lectin [Leishmania infantum JPCM5]CAC9465572.1 mannose-specific_lectin_-_putative [Leishmania infantum]CAM66462.1 putative lectin [Leishmania infantum JPCM5]SUZ40116.1 mannose-specific_lectin_-_putative [Leishmania infantum]|eukprot:XP_001464086.1 putative lectin [Leishmania infantum JPCM5]